MGGANIYLVITAYLLAIIAGALLFKAFRT
jgi:hypothetical protein